MAAIALDQWPPRYPFSFFTIPPALQEQLGLQPDSKSADDPSHRDLLPILQQRDETSVTLAKQSAELRSLLDALTEVEGHSLRISRENVDLAAEMLQLAEQSNRGKAEPVTDPDLAAEITELEAQVRASRKKWRVVKGAASAIVAGSSVDWARDPGLRDIVLDAEDDAI